MLTVGSIGLLLVMHGLLLRVRDRRAPPAETRPHPHNVYLQVWCELGLIGALLFGWIGVALLRSVARIDPALRRFSLTQYAASTGVVASSFGIWQMWFQVSLIFAALTLLAATRAGSMSRSRSEPEAA